MQGENEKTGLDDFDPAIDPFTGERILSREEMDAIGEELKTGKQHQQSIDEQERELLAEGWKTLPEAMEATQLSRTRLQKKASILLKRGSSLVWQRSANYPHLFAPELLAEMADSVQKEAELRAEGWKTTPEVAKVTGRARAFLVKSGKRLHVTGEKAWQSQSMEYLFSPLFVEEVVAQKEKLQDLRSKGWKTIPETVADTGYSQGALNNRVPALYANNDPQVYRDEVGYYYLHPDYVDALKASNQGAKKLREEGWKTIAETAEATKTAREAGWKTIAETEDSTSIARHRINGQIHKLLKSNSPDVYKNERTGEYLLSPSFVIHLQEIAQEEQRRVDMGWKTVAEAAAITGMAAPTMHDRANNLKAKQSSLVWQNGVSGKWFFDPDYIEQIRTAAAQGKELLQQGWHTLSSASSATGISIAPLSKKAKKLQDEGSVMVWKSDLSSTSNWLYHPDYIKELGEKISSVRAEEARLKNDGWKTTIEASEAIGFDSNSLTWRARELVEAGSSLVWRNPDSGSFLIHQDYIDELAPKVSYAKQEEARLKQEGWLSIPETSAITGLHKTGLGEYARKLSVTQNPLVWKNDISGIWLFHPDWVSEKAAAKGKEFIPNAVATSDIIHEGKLTAQPEIGTERPKHARR